MCRMGSSRGVPKSTAPTSPRCLPEDVVYPGGGCNPVAEVSDGVRIWCFALGSCETTGLSCISLV